MKRVVLICVLLLSGALLFATGQAGGSAPDEILTITALYGAEEAAPTEMDIWGDLLRDKFGIQYETIYVPNADVNTKLPLMFASGEYPEQMQMNWNWGVSAMRVMLLNHIPGGYLIPVDDYIDRMPNYQAQYTKTEWEFLRGLLSAGDGRMYLLPAKYPWSLDRGFIYNKAEFDKLGLEYPGTTDELLDVMRAFKAEYPNSVPLTHKWGWPGSLTFGIRESFRTYDAAIYDQDAGKVVYGPATNKYRDMLRFLATCYKEGLIEKDLFHEIDNWTARFANNETFIAGGWMSWMGFANNTARPKYPDVNWVVATKEIRAYPDKPTLVYLNPAAQPIGPVFTAKMDINSEKFARWIKYAEWALTKEGIQDLVLGKEGVTYDMVNGKPVARFIAENGNPDTTKMKEEYGVVGARWTASVYDLQHMLEVFPTNKPMIDAKKNFGHLPAVGFVYGGFTAEEIDEKVDMEVILAETRSQITLQFVMGQKDINSDAEWNDYIKELEKLGLEKYVSYYQSAWDRAPLF